MAVFYNPHHLRNGNKRVSVERRPAQKRMTLLASVVPIMSPFIKNEYWDILLGQSRAYDMPEWHTCIHRCYGKFTWSI